MKRTFLIFLATALLSGCYKDDIRDLKKEIDSLKEQMAQYGSLLDAVEKRLYVTGYEAGDSYYVIGMSDGSSLSVRSTASFIKIGENGNWWIDGTDTGHSSTGKTPEITVGGNGNWWIDGEDTGISSRGKAGADASEIISIALVDGVMTFVFSDGRTVSIDTALPEISIDEPEGGFSTSVMQWFRIHPQIENTGGAVYTWTVNDAEIAFAENLLHVFAAAGRYDVKLTVKNAVGEASRTVSVTVNSAEYTGGIAKVYEYMPAPGQFINTIPEATAGDTPETVRQKAEDLLKSGAMISLGSFGGYVIFGFDHTVINRQGSDFAVLGNAHLNSAEPGVISVSYDANANGLPDDEWYEVAGSEHRKSSTVHGYTVTWYRPASEPSNPAEPEYIRWTDNRGQSGWIPRNSFHAQPYFPLWAGESYTLSGTFMPSGLRDQSGDGSMWTSAALDWGYADNWPDDDPRAQIDIDWAVDGSSNPANLKGIDFVKVHTANLALGGWTGEASTEVRGFTDLNIGTISEANHN